MSPQGRTRIPLLVMAILIGTAPHDAGIAASQQNGSAAADLTSRPAVSSEVDEQPGTRKPFTSKAFGATLESEPPGYVRTLSKTGIPALEYLDWLEFGLQHRTRWEYRDDDYRRNVLLNDDQFLLRSRGYLGVKKILDPLRFGIEFQDARQFGSRFGDESRDVNEADILQLRLHLPHGPCSDINSLFCREMNSDSFGNHLGDFRPVGGVGQLQGVPAI